MRTRLMIATAAAAAMLAGAALAQPAANDASAPASLTPPGAAVNDSVPAGGDTAQPNGAASTDVAPAAGAPAERAPAASAGDVDLVTNGPIPDTKANRAKYGMPLSHAGKMSPPSGN